ncbi:hypothetical protein [Liquorilactobacillus satsumensis]|uniref:hypothetical protein n=1 Tax=Liquorilactobacillus satsumensis TaxID=259059 RepID=UPI001E63E047|nr:hypothetical protein [Liquorilactobacillus satsumensis]MCP9358420.1 hypothetical protein [Liquorilactobacillus satsumensis]MCP9372374.1 hypothetical protein [Liquorilactobacillus satsumensis]
MDKNKNDLLKKNIDERLSKLRYEKKETEDKHSGKQTAAIIISIVVVAGIIFSLFNAL